MLNTHNDIRFIIIDYGFTRKTVYKTKQKNMFVSGRPTDPKFIGRP